MPKRAVETEALARGPEKVLQRAKMPEKGIEAREPQVTQGHVAIVDLRQV